MPDPIGIVEILYEHPEWFQLLFAELERRRIPFRPRRADQLIFDPEAAARPELVINRMSPSSWKRGHGHGIFATRDYLAHLEQVGVPVINGLAAWDNEISKARQLDLFRRAGVAYPRARVINHPSLAAEAARGLRFPVVVKPNIGGSGAGIVRFDTPEQLAAADLDLGFDQVALVQEFVPARGGTITRIEVLDGEFLYAIRIHTDFTSFNLCPADICRTEDAGACPAEGPKRGLKVERVDPPRQAIEGALRLARLARLDVGGIEYLTDDRTGETVFYDINALSNFVANAVEVVGFDPTARFVDFVERRLAAAGAAPAAALA
jgi:glutathione synthase/RimK-type ligase-like ATP-grasp enzyme